MGAARHVKLFKNGRNQAVRIPREFELPGEDAIIRKEDGKLVIEPSPPRSLLALLAMALGRTLVTDNLGEFKRVGGLSTKNWLP